jgi:hypothetical protein
MTTPRVTELPLHLEAVTTDPFPDGQELSPTQACRMRELDFRRNDGIDVRLLWNQVDDRITVAVFDAKTGAAFDFEVEGHEARDAFHHPFAHAAVRGIDLPA